MKKRLVLLTSLWCLFLMLSTGTSYAQLLSEIPENQIASAQTVWQQLQNKEGKMVFDQCTSEVQQHLTVNQLNGLVQTLEMQMGKYQRNEEWTNSFKDEYTVVTARIHFAHGDIKFTVSYNPSRQIAGIFFAPMAKKVTSTPATAQEAFIEKEITVGNVPYKLTGLLTLPPVKHAIYPCVILVHGSGAHDMNEQIGPNKPFQDLAHGLAQQGIASIRYNKRTYQHTHKMSSTVGIQEVTIDDAIAASKLAQNMPNINPKQVYVLGHSLGGMCLPRIIQGIEKTCTHPVAGGIFMAANASPMEDLILWQMKRNNLPAQQLDNLKKSVANVKKIHTTDFDKTIPLPLKLSPAFWKSIIGHEQVHEAAACVHPMLFLFGERDIQVPISEMDLWKQGLKDKIIKHQASFISYPNLSHLMMPAGATPSIQDYQKKAQIAPKVIDDIANWIKKHQL